MAKIALILNGSASLGAYTAGAVTELLCALQRNRRGVPVQVGAVVGSSMGALTAAVAARALIVNWNLLPWLEKVWLAGMDASVLWSSSRSARSSFPVASALELMTRALITAEPASDDGPSDLAAESLAVGIALSNPHGVPREYRLRFESGRGSSFARPAFDDWVDFRLDRSHTAGAPLWEEIRQATLASASFPFAFPPRRLDRPSDPAASAGSPSSGRPTAGAWYLDGGLFADRPVGLAKRLVDRTSGPDDEWRYVFVDPVLRVNPSAQGQRTADRLSGLDVASQLSRALVGTRGAEDWIRASRTNERLCVLEPLIDRLPEIAEPLTDPEAFELSRSVGQLAEAVCERRVASGERAPGGAPPGPGQAADPALELLEHELSRVERRFEGVLQRAGSRAARSRLAKLLFLMEVAGGLEERDRLSLHLIAPSGELAGELLGNFGGLLSRGWREADFRAGRRDARRLIENELGEIIEYEPDPEAAYLVPEVEASMAALPAEEKRRLERVLDGEIGRWLEDLDAGPLGNLLGFAWKPALRRRATRRAMETLAGTS